MLKTSFYILLLTATDQKSQKADITQQHTDIQAM